MALLDELLLATSEEELDEEAIDEELVEEVLAEEVLVDSLEALLCKDDSELLLELDEGRLGVDEKAEEGAGELPPPEPPQATKLAERSRIPRDVKGCIVAISFIVDLGIKPANDSKEESRPFYT